MNNIPLVMKILYIAILTYGSIIFVSELVSLFA